MTSRRAPIGRLVDFVVAVPTSTFVAAARAVPMAARVGTHGTARLVGRVSEAVYDMRHDDDVEMADDVVAVAPDDGDVVSASEDLLSVEELPIEGYDDLAARQVVDRLGALDRDELAQVEIYERMHRNRSTVLGKISMLSA